MVMKRKENRVPEFDEIIFENRNREYGAYDLRKRYNSVISFSILVAVAFCVTIVTVSFKTTENTKGQKEKVTNIIAVIDDYDPSLVQVPPAAKPPAELVEAPQNIAPKVVTDTSVITSFIPIMEELTRTVTDGDVDDTIMVVVENQAEIAPPEPEPYVFVEEQPEFPGGNKALLAYIAKNLVYPREALDNNIEGRVILKFVVKADGSVGRIELLKGVDPLLDLEAMRVISTLPKLKPGKQNGVPVPVWFSVPVTFQLIIN
jgi:protein TonB